MKDDGEEPSKKQQHLAAIETIMERESIVLSPRDLVYLLANLQSNVTFQRQVIKALASAATENMDWDLIDKMVEAAETSENILERFIFEVAGE